MIYAALVRNDIYIFIILKRTDFVDRIQSRKMYVMCVSYHPYMKIVASKSAVGSGASCLSADQEDLVYFERLRFLLWNYKQGLPWR